MAYIYAYAPDAQDCSTIGLAGALMDEEARFDLRAGEFGELTFTHPVDAWGKWRALVNGAIVKTMVPMRLCPEIGPDGAYAEKVDVYRVAATATKAQRYIYSASAAGARGDKKKKLLGAGQSVTVTGVADAASAQSRYRVKLGRVSGYMERGGLELIERDVAIQPTPAGLERAQPSYAVRQQLFRICEVSPRTGANDPGRVEVRARRIAYDLLGNVTTYKDNGVVSCREACEGVLAGALMPHEFSVHTDIGETHAGFDAADKNPIEALIDPAGGAAARWGAQVVSDDYDIYLLRRAGIDRGVRIEYRKNLSGVELRADAAAAATAIRPRGEAKDGGALYLDGRAVNGRHGYNRTGDTCADWLPEGFKFYEDPSGALVPSVVVRADARTAGPDRLCVLDVKDARVEKGTAGVTAAVARRRMAGAALARFADGCDSPEVSLRVDFVALGDADAERQYRHLEPLFVYDTVHIRDARIGLRADVSLTAVSWLVREERVAEARFGALSDMTAAVAGWQISGVDGSKIAPGSVGAGQLEAGTVSARHMQAGSVSADAVQAGAITAEKLAAGAVSAQSVAAVTAAIGSVTAEDIAASALAASLAHLFSLVADNIRTGTVTADALDAVMASVVAAQFQAGTFDLATITNLLASALVLQQGTAGSMYITNLAVTSANLLNATVGKLVVKGEDDNYYEIFIGADGVISTRLYEATAQEIADGVTTDGRQIVEETVNAQTITGDNIRAQEAVFDRVLTAALTAGKITANDAMLASASIPLLYATSVRALGDTIDISANRSITLLADEMRRVLRLDAEGLHVGDSQTLNEVLIDSGSVNVVLGAVKYSKFASDYVQFGDYQLRRSVDGGLVFKKA